MKGVFASVRFYLGMLAAGLLFGAPLASYAQTSTSGSPFSGPGPGEAFTTVCEDCFFPFTVGGAPVSGPANEIPYDAAHASVCWCHSFIVPIPGVVWGEWLPQRIIETVRTPFHSPTLGANLGGSGTSAISTVLQGGLGSQQSGTARQGFYNMHVFAYPFGKVASGLLGALCAEDESGGPGDALWISEIDPSWDSDAIAVIMSPEAAIFASMPAQLSCMADGASADVYQPIDVMFWCMGSWGAAYPEDGGGMTSDAPRQANYVVSKALAMMMRRGMVYKTMGDDAVCNAYYEPEMIKDQFKIQQVWPNPELISNHWIGQDPNIWGEYRYIPIVGEDFINIVWQFSNCCIL